MRRKKSRYKKPATLTILLTLLALFLLYIASFLVFPDVPRLAKKNPETTAFMEFRKSEWKEADRKKKVVRFWVPYHRISPVLIKAVVISEDAKFWRHDGFDFEAIHYAVEKNIRTRTFKLGASTITQQLAKNLYLSPSKNPVRKIKEAILTWRIERSLSKRRILELYLNLIEWGDGLFGIEAASRHYYGISATDLSTWQSATLAAVLPNPVRYSPTSGQRFVKKRSEMIYKLLHNRAVTVETTGNRSDSSGLKARSMDTSHADDRQLDDVIDSLIDIMK